MSVPIEPSGCTWCGIAQRVHGRQYVDAVGWHQWEQPSQERILARMKARRLQLAVAKVGALPMPVGTGREVPDGEHYAAVHHDYRVPRDLPETGGAR